MNVFDGPLKMAVAPTKSMVFERCTKMSPGSRKRFESGGIRSSRYLMVSELRTSRPDDVADRLSVGVPPPSLPLRPEYPFLGPCLTRSPRGRRFHSAGIVPASVCL